MTHYMYPMNTRDPINTAGRTSLKFNSYSLALVFTMAYALNTSNFNMNPSHRSAITRC